MSNKTLAGIPGVNRIPAHRIIVEVFADGACEAKCSSTITELGAASVLCTVAQNLIVQGEAKQKAKEIEIPDSTLQGQLLENGVQQTG